MIKNILTAIMKFIEEYFATQHEVVPPLDTPSKAPKSPESPVLPPEPIPTPKYLWNTPENIRHSMRVIGDEFKMTVLQKDLLCDVCRCESGYKLTALLVNSPTSRDRGLFQINSHFHPEATDELAYDPEWSTRWACRAIINKQVHTFWSASEHCWNATGKYDSIIK